MAEELSKTNFIKDWKVFIYGKFDDSIFIEIVPGLMKLLEEKKLQKEPRIDFHINSWGGHVDTCFELVSIIEKAQKAGIKFRMHAFGGCHSAASVLFVCGDERNVSPYLSFIIHDCRNEFYQSNSAMIQNIAEYIVTVNKNMVDIYMNHTKAKKERLEKVMKEDMYSMKPAELIKLGFAENIT